MAARNLEGLPVLLPDAFSNNRNVVIVAFQRDHQALVDSWLPFLEGVAANCPDFSFFEVPALKRIWAPARRFIDGGMAAAIGDPTVLRRTFTIYGDLGRLTRSLHLTTTSTIAIVLIDREGVIRWSGVGPFDPSTSDELTRALNHW